MEEQQQKEIAVFRFGVISDFVTRAHLDHGEQERLLQHKCAQSWQIPYSNRSRIARSTLLTWIRRYKQSGGKLTALYPKQRSDQGRSRAIDADTAQSLIRLRKELPTAPVGILIAEMRLRGLAPLGLELRPATVYRFLHRQGLMEPEEPAAVDRRRFEAEWPNDVWQSDAMHGPMVTSGGKRRKTYLFAFLDDMSRLITHAEFYGSERLDSYLDALRQALLKRGLPRKLYVDNGPAFRSRHLQQVTASLGIALVHSQPYQPQGRGKIERWFRTVQGQFLPGFKGHSLEELNQALDCWIRDVYHPRKHASTGESPLKRFTDHMQCVRAAPKELEDHFRKSARRRVAKDRTVSLNGKLYEAPVALIAKQVMVLYHEHDLSRVEILHQGRSYGRLTPLDLHVNYRVGRRSSGLVLKHTPEKPLAGGKLPFRDQKEPS
jgi:transposase InsO family protein